jgi:probable phosphoglycerate mutase
MTLRLYLLRHGETEASQTGGYCGRLDPDLTEAGHLMAADFAEAYQGHRFAAVYVSPMRRAGATARSGPPPRTASSWTCWPWN